MIETYAFKKPIGYKQQVEDTLTFETLKSEYGMYLRGVTDTAATNWNLSSTTSPFSDGADINYKTAQSREITIEFGYTGEVAPNVADEYLFNFLGLTLCSSYLPFNNVDYLANSGIKATNKITLIKTLGNSTKTIDGVIKAVEHLVYTDEPTLKISMVADAYWKGENKRIELPLVHVSEAGGLSTYGFSNLTFEGHVMCPYKLNINFDSFVTTSYEMTFKLNLFGYFGMTTQVNKNAFGWAPDFDIIIDNGRNLSARALYHPSTLDYNIVVDILPDTDGGSMLTRLVPNFKITYADNPYFNLQVDSTTAGYLDADINHIGFYIDYYPLYIR